MEIEPEKSPMVRKTRGEVLSLRTMLSASPVVKTRRQKLHAHTLSPVPLPNYPTSDIVISTCLVSD